MISSKIFAKKRIYLDYASLTPIDKRVLEVMNRYSGNEFANPSSLYREGVAAKKALDSARKSILAGLHSAPDQNTGEIVFTSGGTESNNLATMGAVESLRGKGLEYSDMHIVVSAIEHSSVRECANALSEKGVTVSVVPVDSRGLVDPAELKKLIRTNTVIVSVMMVNNEIGTVEPIREIAKVIRQIREAHRKSGDSKFNFQDEVEYPLFHTDAAQALYEDVFVDQLSIDLLTLDGSKVYGPRGIGALYIRRGTPVAPLLHGGSQENGLRSGTENIPAIMGFARALELVREERQHGEVSRLNELRGLFIQGLKKIRPGMQIHGDGAGAGVKVSPHILNVGIPALNNEFFVLQLDAKGVACSTKSSCLRDEDESYVLKAIGARSRESVRFSFGRFTTEKQVREALRIISTIT